MQPHDQGPLNEEELVYLEEFLSRTSDQALELESVDGLFAALVCSPILVPPSQWMPMIWGGEFPKWESIAEVEEFTGLIMRHWNDVASSINDGTYGPLMSTDLDEKGNEVLMPQMWCMGFLEAMNLHEDLWLKDDDLELGDLLAPIRTILLDTLEKKKAKQLSQDEINEIAEVLPDHVIGLREYWLAHPVPDAATRRPQRAAPKVGRNEPCPCGSGKKFKLCHGAGGAVH